MCLLSTVKIQQEEVKVVLQLQLQCHPQVRNSDCCM